MNVDSFGEEIDGDERGGVREMGDEGAVHDETGGESICIFIRT